MRRMWSTMLLSALLLATSARAARTPENDSASKESPEAAQATAKKKPAATKKAVEKSPAEALSAQLEQLRKSLEAQQQQIQQLREELAKRDQQIGAARDAAAAASTRAEEATSKASEAASSAAEAKTTAAAVSSDVSDMKLGSESLKSAMQDTQKKVIGTEGKIKGLGPFTFSGDVRVRYEPFFGGGAESSPAPPDRHRQRFRLRFNVNAKFNDEISGGLTLASGNIGDPISTNQTEGDFLTRKPIAIDKAFLTYKPKWFKPFSATAGKYGYTWYRTELTFDNDMNVEGASEQVMWDWKDRVFSHFGVVAFQTPLLEVNANTDAGAKDTGLFGGQIQTGWTLGKRVKLTADTAFYHYRNADRIAQNQNSGNGFASSGTSTGLGGTFGFGGSNNTNNVFNVVSGATTTRFFLSQFDIFDAILRADFDTGHPRWPVVALFNFAQNTAACSNKGTVLAAFAAANPASPLPTLTCDPHQRHGYWSEARFGRLSEQKDIQFAYTFMRIEKDAVVAAFDFSDLRQSTNVAQHRVEFFYQAYKNVTLGFTGLIGRQLITAQSPTPERYLKRLQFDVAYKF